MTVSFMTLAGPVDDPGAICDQLLMAVFASDYSQSNAFLGHVASFQYLVHAAGNNYRTMATGLEGMFTTLFQRHFAVASVVVDVEPIPDDQAKMVISLEATLTTDTGFRLDLASTILAIDGRAMEILVGERQLWKR